MPSSLPSCLFMVGQVASGGRKKTVVNIDFQRRRRTCLRVGRSCTFRNVARVGVVVVACERRIFVELDIGPSDVMIILHVQIIELGCCQGHQVRLSESGFESLLKCAPI